MSLQLKSLKLVTFVLQNAGPDMHDRTNMTHEEWYMKLIDDAEDVLSHQCYLFIDHKY